MRTKQFRAVVSSDWSECLSPNGPFDPIAFVYPQLKPQLSGIFKRYTGNKISLNEAVSTIRQLLPGELSRNSMDAYLDAAFKTYKGVPELIEWCLSHDILFMINTTGSQGYFQRAIAKRLIPEVPFIAANPILQFPERLEGDRYRYEVLEIDDKPRNTQAVLESLNLTGRNLVVMGDSGGDGPHFHWASGFGGFLIGSMVKPSLLTYCTSREVFIDKLLGIVYAPDEPRDVEKELQFNFMELTEVIAERLEKT
jgi:hypothetical protein